MSDNHLERLVNASLEQMAARAARAPLAQVRARALEREAPRGFVSALMAAQARGDNPLIAEVKRASPSRGVIAKDLDPARLARAYEKGGAACMSVLTERASFGGSLEDLVQARSACSLPVLRKDFLVSCWPSTGRSRSPSTALSRSRSSPRTSAGGAVSV